MKLTCEIIGVDSNGDSMTLRLQGKPDKSAEWRPWARQELKIPATAQAMRGFHLGRNVTLEIKPR